MNPQVMTKQEMSKAMENLCPDCNGVLEDTERLAGGIIRYSICKDCKMRFKFTTVMDETRFIGEAGR